MSSPAFQEELFESAFQGPEGFTYQPAFITREEESALLAILRTLPFQEAKFQQYTARRRTVRYGTQYDPASRCLMKRRVFLNFCCRYGIRPQAGSNYPRKISCTAW